MVAPTSSTIGSSLTVPPMRSEAAKNEEKGNILHLFFQERVLTETNLLQKVIKVIANGCLLFVGPTPMVQQRLGHLDLTIDSVGLANDIRLVNSGRFSPEGIKTIVFGLAFVAANIGCTFVWLAEFGIVNLGNLASKIGSLKVFGHTPLSFVASITAGGFLNGSVGIAFFYMGAHWLDKIVENPSNVYAWIAVAYCVAEVAGKVLYFTGAGTMVVAGVNLTAALFAFPFHLYPSYKKSEIQAQAQSTAPKTNNT